MTSGCLTQNPEEEIVCAAWQVYNAQSEKCENLPDTVPYLIHPEPINSGINLYTTSTAKRFSTEYMDPDFDGITCKWYVNDIPVKNCDWFELYYETLSQEDKGTSIFDFDPETFGTGSFVVQVRMDFPSSNTLVPSHTWYVNVSYPPFVPTVQAFPDSGTTFSIISGKGISENDCGYNIADPPNPNDPCWDEIPGVEINIAAGADGDPTKDNVEVQFYHNGIPIGLETELVSGDKMYLSQISTNFAITLANEDVGEVHTITAVLTDKSTNQQVGDTLTWYVSVRPVNTPPTIAVDVSGGHPDDGDYQMAQDYSQSFSITYYDDDTPTDQIGGPGCIHVGTEMNHSPFPDMDLVDIPSIIIVEIVRYQAETELKRGLTIKLRKINKHRSPVPAPSCITGDLLPDCAAINRRLHFAEIYIILYIIPVNEAKPTTAHLAEIKHFANQ